MNWSDIILQVIMPIILAMLAGCNILQLLNNRQLKKKLEAEADQEENKSWLQIIAGQTAEISRLQTAYSELQAKYFELSDEMQSLKAEMVGKRDKRKLTTKK